MTKWVLGLCLLFSMVGGFAYGADVSPGYENIVFKEYVVGKGETVAQIYRNFGLSDDEIFPEQIELFLQYNPHIPDADWIAEGDHVVVPVTHGGRSLISRDNASLDYYVPLNSLPGQKDEGSGNKLSLSREMPTSTSAYSPLPSVQYISKTPAKLTPKEQKAVSLAQKWKERSINPFPGAAGQVKFVFGATMPTLVCAPLQPTDLELQPGEQINDIFLGDTARWVVSVGNSGPAGNERAHLIIKPYDAGLETSAVITTDRRTYHLKLVSDPKKHIPYVGFTYPEEEHAALQRKIAERKRQEHWGSAGSKVAEMQGKEMRLSELDFSYRITGDDVSWRPEQVYNDGHRTVIRFPDAVRQTDMPVLFVEQGGEKTLVNYRASGASLIVDGVFSRALLLSGSGREQKKIVIQRMEKS